MEEVPGFAVGLPLVEAVSGADADGVLEGCDIGGNDVPDISGNTVNGQVIEIGWLVTVVGSVDVEKTGDEVAGLQVTRLKVSGLDLNADEMAANVEDDVVRSVVPAGLGGMEAEFEHLGHEEKLGPQAARFVSADG